MTTAKDVKTLSEHISNLRDKLAVQSFCLDEEEDLLPSVAHLLTKLTASDSSILDRVNLLSKKLPALDETEGGKQFELLKDEFLSTVQTTVDAERKIKPLFRNPSSSKAKNQPLVDFLAEDLVHLKSKFGIRPSFEKK